jgi:hypothetical protein
MLSNDLVKYVCMYSDLRMYWEDVMFVEEFTGWQTYSERAAAFHPGRAATPDTQCRKLITS